MKITLAQINPHIGDMAGNIELMLDAAMKAEATGAQIVIFPELSLTGYYPGDLLDDARFCARVVQSRLNLLQATKATPTLVWVVGAVTANTGNGKPFHNGLLVLRDGEQLSVTHKQLLPTGGIFDERRHFEPGPDVARVLRLGDTQIGFLICEDGWNDDLLDYKVNPFQRLADAAPDLVISINASPANIGKREQRHSIIGKACARHRLPLVYVNQVGGFDSLIYDGGSFAADATGKIVFEAARFATDIATVEFDPKSQRFAKVDGGTLAPASELGLDPMDFYLQQIILGVRDYARRCGFTKAVVGSSGGIDSALTLALAVQALGAENVVAITMPSAYSSEGSVSDSVTLCKNLGITLLTHPIGGLVDRYSQEFSKATGEPLKGLALENLQARIRGTILMEYSNSFGHLLLTTGNKSEVSVGYYTLYGDSAGGLGPIGDLYKTEVFDLCRHINSLAARDLIPVTIIDKPPSAELAPGQKDSDSLPPYPVLDTILKVLIEGSRLGSWERQAVESQFQEIEASEKGREMIARVQKMIAGSEFKRRQSAPILRLRGRAFGSGRQVPICAKQF